MHDKILRTLEGIAHNGPTRVVINSDGETISSMRAKQENKIEPDVIFVRNDGWSLGAPISFYDVAEKLWGGDWIMVIFRPFPKMDDQGRLVVRHVE